MFQENLKLAEHELVTVLQTFPNDDNATLMLAELKFRSNDYVNAIAHYKYILNRKPSELTSLGSHSISYVNIYIYIAILLLSITFVYKG